MYYLLAAIFAWMIIGCICVVRNWTRDIDLKLKHVPHLFITGMVAGPVIGLVDLWAHIFEILLPPRPPRAGEKILIKRKQK